MQQALTTVRQQGCNIGNFRENANAEDQREAAELDHLREGYQKVLHPRVKAVIGHLHLPLLDWLDFTMSAQLGMGSSSEVQCPAVEVATTSDSGDQTTETARPGLRPTPSDGSGELPALMSTRQGLPLTSGTEALVLHREGEEPSLSIQVEIGTFKSHDTTQCTCGFCTCPMWTSRCHSRK